MTHRDIRDYLRDILETIDLAESFIQEMTFEAFQAELLQQQPRALAKPSVGKNANESRSGV
jgi:uncharacterized protein with HEPN domain